MMFKLSLGTKMRRRLPFTSTVLVSQKPELQQRHSRHLVGSDEGLMPDDQRIVSDGCCTLIDSIIAKWHVAVMTPCLHGVYTDMREN